MTTQAINITVQEKGAKTVARNFQLLANNVNSSSQSLVGFSSVLKLAFGGLSLRLIQAYGDEFTNIQNRLKIVTKSHEDLTNATRELLNISAQTRSDFGATAELFTRLSQDVKILGATQSDYIKVTKAINQATILSGASSIEAAGGIRQLTQGMSIGALRGEELRSVMENIRVVADVIAKKKGVDRGALLVLGPQGKITGKDIFEGFIEQYDELNTRFGLTSSTISQAFSVLRNETINLIGQFNGATGAMSAVAQGILALAKTLRVLADNIDTVSASIGVFITTFATLKTFKFVSIFAGFGEVLPQFGTLVKYIKEIEKAKSLSVGNAIKNAISGSAVSSNKRFVDASKVITFKKIPNTYNKVYSDMVAGATKLEKKLIDVGLAISSITTTNVGSKLAELGSLFTFRNAGSGLKSISSGVTSLTKNLLTGQIAASLFSKTMNGLVGTLRIATKGVLILGAAIIANPIGFLVTAIVTATVATAGLIATFGQFIKTNEKTGRTIKDEVVSAFIVFKDVLKDEIFTEGSPLFTIFEFLKSSTEFLYNRIKDIYNVYKNIIAALSYAIGLVSTQSLSGAKAAYDEAFNQFNAFEDKVTKTADKYATERAEREKNALGLTDAEVNLKRQGLLLDFGNDLEKELSQQKALLGLTEIQVTAKERLFKLEEDLLKIGKELTTDYRERFFNTIRLIEELKTKRTVEREINGQLDEQNNKIKAALQLRRDGLISESDYAEFVKQFNPYNQTKDDLIVQNKLLKDNLSVTQDVFDIEKQISDARQKSIKDKSFKFNEVEFRNLLNLNQKLSEERALLQELTASQDAYAKRLKTLESLYRSNKITLSQYDEESDKLKVSKQNSKTILEQIDFYKEYNSLTQKSFEVQSQLTAIEQAAIDSKQILTDVEKEGLKTLIEKLLAYKTERDLLTSITSPLEEYAETYEFLNRKLAESTINQLQFNKALNELRFGSDVIGDLELSVESLKNTLTLDSTNADIVTQLASFQKRLKELGAPELTPDEIAKFTNLKLQEDSLKRQVELYREINGPQQEYLNRLEAIAELQKSGDLNFSDAQRLTRQATINSLSQSTDVFSGIKRGFLEVQNNITDYASLMETSLTNAFSGAEDAIVSLVTTGKASFKDLAKSILEDLTRLAIRKYITSALFSGISGGFGAFGEGGSGNFFQGFISAFGDGQYAGGPVSPNTIYPVGERGPELFVPTTQGNIIPNNQLKNGGGDVTINMTVNTPNADSFRKSASQIRRDISRGFGR